MIKLVLVSTFFGVVYGDFQFQIVHNNDMHARFAETNMYGASCPDELIKENKCFGGFARVKQAAKDAIEEAALKGIPSIFLNAGDTFQGTPYYTFYKWKIVGPLFESLGFDVSCLGNHEFDDGIDNLVMYLKSIKTPIVACNLNLTSEKRLDLNIMVPSKVLTVNGVKIGVIGYLTPETKYMSTTENLQILEEIPQIRAEAKRLKSIGINIIIALGHSGFDMDMKIAAQISEITAVVGGHSHTLLYSPKDKPPSTESAAESYPYMVTQESGKKVPVVQAYAYTKYLGKLMITVDDDGNVISAHGNPQLLDNTVKKDPHVNEMVSSWTRLVKDRLSVIKGYTRVFLQKSNFYSGEYESNLANLITDSMIDVSVQNAKKNNLQEWASAPISLLQNGGIRTQIDNAVNDGAITLENLLIILPFQNKLCELTIRGSTIKEALEHSVSTQETDAQTTNFRYFLHFSGMKVVYDLEKPIGNRVVSVMTLCNKCSVPHFEPLNDNQTYTVITNSYLAGSGDRYTMLQEAKLNITFLETIDTDAFVTYLEKNKIVYPKLEGRITVLESRQVSSASTNKAFLFTFCVFLCFVNL